MTDEMNDGYSPDELGIEPEPVENEGAVSVAQDGTATMTDEMRNSILLDAIQRGEMIPSWMAGSTGQPDTPPDYQQDDAPASESDTLVFKGELDRLLAEAEKRAEQRILGQVGPHIASITANTLAQEAAEIMPEAAPIVRQIVQQMGAGAMSLTNEAKKLLIDAAVGKAYLESRRRVPTHESTGSSPAPRYVLADGVTQEDVEFYSRQYQENYGKRPDAKHLREVGYLR
jgi:hypothetical protein